MTEDINSYAPTADDAPLPEKNTEAFGEEFAEHPFEDDVLPRSDSEPGGESDDELYKKLMDSDLKSLKSEFPEMNNAESILELDDPERYATLRDLGLTPAEAYLATQKRRVKRDTRSHLHSAVMKLASSPKGAMSENDLKGARELFTDLSDSEIRQLYRKVNG